MYAPYGEQLHNQHPYSYRERFTFTGKEKDEETGYYYFGARNYLPALSIWGAVDPLADKYIYNSPYVYCDGNPIKYIDPNGKRIVFAKGTTLIQKQQFYKAIRYLNQNQCGGRYGQLKRSKRTYTIRIFDGNENVQFDRNNLEISWSPTLGLDTEHDGVILSPTTLLNHEMTHATHEDDYLEACEQSQDPENTITELNKAYKKAEAYVKSLKPDANNSYGSEEEESVITGVEQRTALMLGEIQEGQVTRENHGGHYVTVTDPTSNEIVP